MVLPFSGLCKTCCFTRGSGIFSHKKGRITMWYEGGACHTFPSLERGGMTTNLLTKIKCFLLTGEVVLHPILGTLNKPSLRIVKKKYSSLPFAFTGILPLPGHSRFVKIYLIRQSLTAFCFSLRPPSSGYSCIRHYLLVPYGF